MRGRVWVGSSHRMTGKSHVPLILLLMVGGGGWVGRRPTIPPPCHTHSHTHTPKTKDTKTGTLECKYIFFRTPGICPSSINEFKKSSYY